MNLTTLINKKPQILAIAQKYGGSNIRVFGSCARNEMTPESDIDLLIDIEQGFSLFHRIQMMQELENLLGRKIDIAKPQNLHTRIRDQILKEAIPL